MTNRRTVRIAILLAAITLVLCIHAVQAQQPASHTLDLTLAKPETVGFSS